MTQKLYTVYYDTEDHDLRRNDIALRLRREGKRWVQTIKGRGGATAGLHQRYEWEVPVTNARPDFTKISDPDLISLLNSAILREKLQPIFTTEFNRSTRMLRLTDGEVEFCLDRGRIAAGEASVPIRGNRAGAEVGWRRFIVPACAGLARYCSPQAGKQE